MLNILMTRPHLDDLPPVELPDGYRLATAAEFGDATPLWAQIINDGFGDQEWPPQTAQGYVDQPQYDPAGVFFVMHGDRPVATAFAWLDNPSETISGRVHWVGTLPECRGKGLARAVVLAVLHYFAARGFQSAFLETQAFRMPAIRLYTRLGFTPTPRNEEEEQEWAAPIAELSADR